MEEGILKQNSQNFVIFLRFLPDFFAHFINIRQGIAKQSKLRQASNPPLRLQQIITAPPLMKNIILSGSGSLKTKPDLICFFPKNILTGK